MRNSYLQIILNSCFTDFTDASSQIDSTGFGDASAADGGVAKSSNVPYCVAEPCFVDVCLSGARIIMLFSKKGITFDVFTFCANFGIDSSLLYYLPKVKGKCGSKQRQFLNLIRVMGRTSSPVTFAEGQISWGQKIPEELVAKAQLDEKQDYNDQYYRLDTSIIQARLCHSLPVACFSHYCLA